MDDQAHTLKPPSAGTGPSLDRRTFLRLSGGLSMVTLVGGAAAFLAACTSSSSASAPASASLPTSSPATAATAVPTAAAPVGSSAATAVATAAPTLTATVAPPTAAPTAQTFGGATVNIIALDGEDGKKELQTWRTDHGVNFAITPNSGWDATFAKLKTDQFDIALVANPFVAQWAQAGVLTPIDTSRLANWTDMFPALRDGDFLRNNGQVYAVPIAWGDGPYVYDPARLKTPPKSIADLLDPAWKNPIVMFDDPIMPFHTIAWSMGIDPNTMSKDQLKQVVAKTKDLTKHVVAYVTGYQDATDYLVRGEADLSLSGWEAMLSFAKDKGKTLRFDFFTEAHGGGWCDSWAIPTTAKNIDAAYAAIDAMIAPTVNAMVATNLISGTVNSKAVDAVAPAAKIYDYSIVQSTSGIKFEDWNPPLKGATANSATKADWDAAWKDLRAGV